jgi:hypothetical protein
MPTETTKSPYNKKCPISRGTFLLAKIIARLMSLKIYYKNARIYGMILRACYVAVYGHEPINGG